MDQEEKIKELEQKIVDIEPVVSKTAFALRNMSISLKPMFLEWYDEKQNNSRESTEVLYG